MVRPVEGFECQSRGRVCPVERYRVNILVIFLSHIFSINKQKIIDVREKIPNKIFYIQLPTTFLYA